MSVLDNENTWMERFYFCVNNKLRINLTFVFAPGQSTIFNWRVAKVIGADDTPSRGGLPTPTDED